MKPVKINSGTELYCIFGSPVRHSFSPLMHNAAFRSAGIDAVYLAFEPPSIGEAVSSMRTLNIRGASVTIPYKIGVMHHVDAVDGLAAHIGSVNTLVNSDGKITGYNTDGYGALLALRNGGVSIDNARCLLLGNGGSARAIACALLESGAGVIIAGRNALRIGGLAEDLRKVNASVTSILLEEINRGFMESIDIIINTTPVGMAPDVEKSPLDIDLIAKRHAVFDIVYAPHVTAFLSAARRRGCAVVHGIDMLVFQGARQFELWTGKPAPVTVMRRAIRKHLRHTR
jgi:shikimate dehydrogenase